MNESAEGKTVRPGLSEVADGDAVILPGPALAPDQDGLHLWAEGLLPGDAQLDSQTCVGRHTSTFAVTETQKKNKYVSCELVYREGLRVQSWSGILDLLNEA